MQWVLHCTHCGGYLPPLFLVYMLNVRWICSSEGNAGPPSLGAAGACSASHLPQLLRGCAVGPAVRLPGRHLPHLGRGDQRRGSTRAATLCAVRQVTSPPPCLPGGPSACPNSRSCASRPCLPPKVHKERTGDCASAVTSIKLGSTIAGQRRHGAAAAGASAAEHTLRSTRSAANQGALAPAEPAPEAGAEEALGEPANQAVSSCICCLTILCSPSYRMHIHAQHDMLAPSSSLTCFT